MTIGVPVVRPEEYEAGAWFGCGDVWRLRDHPGV